MRRYGIYWRGDRKRRISRKDYSENAKKEKPLKGNF